MKITVIGTGYVGLVTGVCFADVGNDVLCIDIDESKIQRLLRGEMPIHEPGLDDVAARNVRAGRLNFSSDYGRAIAHSDVFFIAVGTPTDEDGSADVRHVEAAARELGSRLHRQALLVVKSTVPVGTAERVRRAVEEELAARAVKVPISVASNPEFLKEGAAMQDFMHPDRIVIGAEERYAIDLLTELYAPFNRNRERLVVLDTRSSELAKYAANAMLATRISFMNELARLSEKLGADIERVRHAIGADPRIGPSFLYAGAGYGGSCFPKDVRALLAMARENLLPARVLSAVHDVNEEQKHLVASRLREALGSDLHGKVVAVWGLAFKPNTDDVREAPSLVLIRDVIDSGARVRAYDPQARHTAARFLSELKRRIEFCDSAHQACEGADALVVVTEWLEFRSPDFAWLARTLRAGVLIDGRNLYEPRLARAAGLRYYGIGRGPAR
ncbi:MAG TPA: UDP-glucose/GDP-mannose dehydrogenase family protein [Burkholderiaceae bacterium]|jgi:UDPglucose 6-dehydrogenase|nr:UDP-glucose/GDP-mannose dehydrogenase family protein [Burkholderiaceae bacterium]